MPTDNPQSPEERLDALAGRVKQLEEQNAELLERLAEVERRARLLVSAKIDNPAQSYSNWLLANTVSVEEWRRLDAVFGVLTCRVLGFPTDDFAERRAQLPPGLAERQGPPGKEEILDALRFATDVPQDRRLLDLIESLYGERLYPSFTEYAMKLFDLPR